MDRRHRGSSDPWGTKRNPQLPSASVDVGDPALEPPTCVFSSAFATFILVCWSTALPLIRMSSPKGHPEDRWIGIGEHRPSAMAVAVADYAGLSVRLMAVFPPGSSPSRATHALPLRFVADAAFRSAAFARGCRLSAAMGAELSTLRPTVCDRPPPPPRSVPHHRGCRSGVSDRICVITTLGTSAGRLRDGRARRADAAFRSPRSP